MTRFSRLLAACLVLAMGAPAHAAIQQVRVMAVGIDRSASKAEAMAIDYAKMRAVYLTARKLPIDKPSDKVAALTAEDYHEIVRGTTVNKIKRDGERTYADVTVSVVDSALRRALALPERASVDGMADEPVHMRGVLVLPLFIKGDRPYLWEKENALREPLRAEVLRQAHGAVLVPAGDLDDLRLIDYANALTVTGEELTPMFERYGAEEIIIAIYTPGIVGQEAEAPTILLRRLTLKGMRAEKLQITGESEKKLTGEQQTRAAAALIANAVTQIASSTASQDRARLAKAKKIAVHFKYANPRELAQMQEALRAQPEVLLVELPAISLGEIKGTAYIEGAPQKLREKLLKTGMLVTESAAGWQLSLR